MHIDPSAALGPDSLAWRYAGDNLQYFLAGTILVLQVAHPVVGAGVGEHSVYKTDPWGRLERTTRIGVKLLYGGPEVAARTAQELLTLHGKIKGTDSRGRRYHALDREAYAWVHLTSYFAMEQAQEHFGTPLSPRQQAQLYREWRQQGRVLGIRDADMPGDLPAFRRYFDAMIRDRLEENEVVGDLLSLSREVPKPPQLALLPDAAWARMYAVAGRWSRAATLGTLPSAFRHKLGLRATAAERLQFETLKATARAGYRFVPPRHRYLPAAYRALREAGVLTATRGKRPPISDARGAAPAASRPR